MWKWNQITDEKAMTDAGCSVNVGGISIVTVPFAYVFLSLEFAGGVIQC